MMMIEQFFRPDSVDQALELKRRYQEDAVWFAGGSKLNATPTRTDKRIAISLQDLELEWIDWDNGALRIGAMTRLQPLHDARYLPAALREAIGFIYSRHLRNQSTLGGEIAAQQQESVLLPSCWRWTPSWCVVMAKLCRWKAISPIHAIACSPKLSLKILPPLRHAQSEPFTGRINRRDGGGRVD